MDIIKKQELMQYLHDIVFDSILNSKTCSDKMNSGANITIVIMNRLSAEKWCNIFGQHLQQKMPLHSLSI